MKEELQLCFDDTKESMEKVIEFTKNEISRIRAGKANPEMLNSIYIDYYGIKTPLHQVSNIVTPDAKTIMVLPWEKELLKPIEQAIKESNIGLNAQNNGEKIIISLPPLTEERRREFVKNIKHIAEQGKVSIRNARKDSNSYIKSLKDDGLSEYEAKNAEDKIQQMTNNYIKIIDECLQVKEKEIMTI